MGGHGHGHHEPYVVPKPEIYNNQVEKIKELKYLQNELAKRGLKDPWIRFVRLWLCDECAFHENPVVFQLQKRCVAIQ